MRAGQRAPVSLWLSHLMEVPQGPASAPCASLETESAAKACLLPCDPLRGSHLINRDLG